MKTILAALLLVSTAAFAQGAAQDRDGNGPPDRGGQGMMGQGMGQGQGMMGQGGPGMMHGMMRMHGLMNSSMVATSDGGIVVLHANKLTKYDKDLNVVKEVEIEGGPEGMPQGMMGPGKGGPQGASPSPAGHPGQQP